MNSKGIATNILPLLMGKKKTKTLSWTCDLCKTNDPEVFNNLKNFLKQLSNCTLRTLNRFLSHVRVCTNKTNTDKFGHSHGCYKNPKSCKSEFISMEILAPHFPRIRYIERLFYSSVSFDKELCDSDKALNNNDVSKLSQISDQAHQKAVIYEKSKIAEINRNEDEIQAMYNHAFRTYTKRVIDTPRFACISCEKLCCEKRGRFIELSKTTHGPIWTSLMEFVAKRYPKPNEHNFLCLYCQDKFRHDTMPPTCILNKLDVRDVPHQIQCLNVFERILIQRVKAFQTVKKLEPILKKNMPQRHKVSKVVGRTFHLPLPLEETMKKICPPTEAINRNHELYILVRGIPTKSKVVWERLVNLKNVWNALEWLKWFNPHYFEISLPSSYENLLSNDFPEVEFQDVTQLQSGSVAQSTNDCTIPNKDDNRPILDINEQKKAALLTQMSQSDLYYEQFTIYPIHEKRVDKTATELYQMLKVHDVPLDNRCRELDTLCFPDLYPYGVNGQYAERSVRLTDYEFTKAKIMSKHSQFRTNIQYIFFLLNNANIRQLSAGIYHKMNITNVREKYTAASYLEKLSRNELESNLTTIFAKLRNSEQYWRIPRNNVRCMTRHYGPATWFLTISPSEWLWPDLIEYLRMVNRISDEVNIDNSELIALDPVSVSRFIDIKFKAVLDFILSPDNPIGEVDHYFYRREYQTRGAQHFHILIWIKDAPIIGKSTTAEIAAFILKYATCRMPDKNVSPQLYRRVNAHQRHRHNGYCLRAKKTKTGFTRRCKFGHPRPLTDTIKIRDVAVSIAGRRRLKTKSRLYDLPCGSNEASINDYNPAILCIWEGNMDIQFIGEVSTILTAYVTKYQTKAEKSNAPDALKVQDSTKSVGACLWNMGMRLLNNRECGALEASDTLLGMSLYGTDPWTTIKWLDVNQVRNRKLKTRKEIQSLDGDSTDLFCPALIDTHYYVRPESLDSMSLYDFARWYDITKTMPKMAFEIHKIGESTYIKKRARPCLINHYMYNVHTEPERYYFSILLLFKPWRDTDELRNGYDTYAEAFFALKSQLEDAYRYHDQLAEIKRGIDYVNEQVEKKLLEDPKESITSVADEVLGCVPKEADDAMKDLKAMDEKLDLEHLTQMIDELNIDQKRVFDKVTSSITSEDDIIRLYVSGEGGTGKSFLIKTLRCWAKKTLGKDTAVAAPTGIAAFNIDGFTIHRLLQLPVEHGRTAKYRELSDGVLKLLRDEMRNTSLIIIDEVSMISNVLFMYIHLRLTEIFNTGELEDGWFGRKHILLFGDLLQLPPVHEEPPFVMLCKRQVEKLIGALGSVDLWSALFEYDELTINMRQKGDLSYRDMLSRIRIGVVNTSDTKILETRKLHFIETTIEGRLRELCEYMDKLPSDTVCLLPTCAQCDALNAAMLSRIPSEEIKLVARDAIDCPAYMKKKFQKCCVAMRKIVHEQVD